MTEFITLLNQLAKNGKIIIAGSSTLIPSGLYKMRVSETQFQKLKKDIEEGLANEFLFNSRKQEADKNTEKKYVKLPVALLDKSKSDAKEFLTGITVTADVISQLSKLGNSINCEVVIDKKENTAADGNKYMVNTFTFQAVTDDKAATNDF